MHLENRRQARLGDLETRQGGLNILLNRILMLIKGRTVFAVLIFDEAVEAIILGVVSCQVSTLPRRAIAQSNPLRIAIVNRVLSNVGVYYCKSIILEMDTLTLTN